MSRWPCSAGITWRRMKPAANAASTASRSSTAAIASSAQRRATTARSVGCELLSAFSCKKRERREPISAAQRPREATKTQNATKPTSTATFAPRLRLGERSKDIATTGRISPMAP